MLIHSLGKDSLHKQKERQVARRKLIPTAYHNNLSEIPTRHFANAVPACRWSCLYQELATALHFIRSILNTLRKSRATCSKQTSPGGSFLQVELAWFRPHIGIEHVPMKSFAWLVFYTLHVSQHWWWSSGVQFWI